MSRIVIPEGYRPPLSVYDTQVAIEFIKHNFQKDLSHALNLRRVSAPLFVRSDSGLNDNLNGVERPVSFDAPGVGCEGEVVHSLAKWKRLALKRYDFRPGKGLYTDMNAIRRDETPDNLHSIYVDQWDWEKIIRREDRTLDYLKRTAQDIVDILFWNERLGRALEISSMGIRVDAESLARQLKLAGCEQRRELPFHRMLLNGELPLTIGGGIGQSRLCMLMIGCAHIGEVQCSLWDDETQEACARAGIRLL